MPLAAWGSAVTALYPTRKKNCLAGEWLEYFKQPAEQRKQLLNVVSLSLADTELQARIRT